MVTKRDGLIEFSYARELLFNVASLRSSYMANTLRDGEGRYVGDDFALSDDEADAFEVCVRSVIADVYEVLLKVTSGVGDAFSIEGGEVVLRIRDNRAYNGNVLAMVDATIERAVVNGVLREWYDTCAKADFYAVYEAKYAVSLNDLRRRLFQLKKKVMA